MDHNNISFVGAGKVASSLCKALFSAGFTIDLVVSENEMNGKAFSQKFNAKWSADPVCPDSSGIIIVSVPDHKLENVLSSLKCSPEAIIAHTAGSYGLDIFPENIKNKGVFYPLQTFSKNRDVIFSGLPVLIESSDQATSDILVKMAKAISANVYFTDPERRKILHIAAVFASNFTNFMLTESKEIAKEAGFSFEIFTPLINETISKAIENGPEDSQTGPAIRNDTNTIEKHLEMLSYSPALQKIYGELSKAINEYYNDTRQK